VRCLAVEALESRVLLSFPPLPIVPASGESQILEQAKKFEQKNNLNALDNLPIPFAVVASHSGGAPVVVKNNPQSAAPMRVEIDVDSNPTTGKGGKDVGVTVSTELFLNGVFNPHLLATYDRLGSAPFASDFEVLVSFPFAAFNAELLPGDPNLFMGYKTTGAGGPNAAGGIAPLQEVIRFVPNIMAGATHPQVDITLATTGASNPLQFITGYFDGTNLTGILDAGAYAAWVATPPANVTIGVGVSNSFPLGSPFSGSINLGWTATSPSKVVFDYLEEESGTLTDADFDTKVTFDQMPTSEQLSLAINESAKTLTLSHRANAKIGTIQVLSERNDGLTITGTASDVPTEVDLTLGLAGFATIDVTPIGHAGTHDNTLDLKIEAKKTGGFLNTADFLGYNIGYAAVELKNVADAFIGFDAATDSAGTHAIDPTESIGSIALIIGDDDDLELPPPQDDLGGTAPWDDPNRHVFSLIDDGTHGTAAARLVHVQDATLHLDAADISEVFTLKFSQAAPLTAYIRTTEDSNLIPDHDVEITLNVNDIPAGQSTFNADFPTDIGYDLPSGAEIDSIHAFGHIDCVFFDVLLGDLPNKFQFTFDPNGALTLLAQDSSGNPDRVGVVAVRLWVPDDTCPGGLLADSALTPLLGDELREARARLDDIPSFHATWSDGANTAINFDTDATDAFLGGAQVAVSTAVDLTALSAASALASDYVALRDRSGVKQLRAGAFGIDAFSYASNDAAASYTLHYDANGQRRATVDVNSAFGGRFFPAFDIHAFGGSAPLDSNANLTLNKVPQLLDLSVDIDPEFHYHGSQGIDAVTLAGSVDDTNDGVNNGTNISASLLGLPKDVDFVLNPASDATLTMNAPATLVALHMDSDNDIFGSGYRLLEGSIANIPAHWSANWAGGQFVLEAKDAADNPAPMGEATVTISTSNVPADNANNIHPFEVSGPGGARINRSPFLLDIDTRFYNAGGAPDAGAATLAVLNDLYNNAEVLTAGEDHALARVNGGALTFFDGKFNGFQKIAYQPDADGGHFEFDAPSPGLHEFLAGVGLDSKFLVAHIDNIPDTAALDIDTAAGDVHFHTTDDIGATAGDIDLYYGPEGMAQDGDTALRGVLQDTPDDVHLTWNFGSSDGDAAFVASQEFRMLFLAQDGSNRITAGLQLKELQAGYGLDFLPLTVSSSTFAGIPTAATLSLFKAHAGIDNDASSAVGTGSNVKPGLSGFFNLYQMTTEDLTAIDDGTLPGAAEYTPTVTFQMKDFTDVLFTINVTVTIISANPFNFPGELHVDPDLSGPHGQFALQLWSSANTDETFLDIIGIKNQPDYVDNTPFFIIPFGAARFTNLGALVFSFDGFGTFADLFDPFA
jgi:hypothetical protein